MKKSLFFLIIIPLFFQACSDEPRNPNIMFIMVDDLGKEWVSTYGADDIMTPHIDQLAKSGIQFENVYCMPQCTPTRTTLLTGQYPFRHGWVNHWDVPRWGGGVHFDETLNPSMGRFMKEAGYKTAVAGKWQINDFRVEPDAMTKHGFDEYCMWTGYEMGVDASVNRYWDLYTYEASGNKTYTGEFGPDIFTQFLIDFIIENKDTSWFIYFPMVLTHGPLVNPPGESAESKMEKHKAMVRYTDKITGELVSALESTGQRKNTIVFWSTDNGTDRGITGIRNEVKVRGGKAQTTENGINVPFIVSAPGLLEQGIVSDVLVDFTDLLPTFLELGGSSLSSLSSQGSAVHKYDGHSFKDYLLGDAPDGNRDWILGMGGGNNARLTKNGMENMYTYRDRVLRNKEFKLYISTKKEAEKFYNLISDPWEKDNLLDRELSEDEMTNYQALLSIIKDAYHDGFI